MHIDHYINSCPQCTVLSINEQKQFRAWTYGKQTLQVHTVIYMYNMHSKSLQRSFGHFMYVPWIWETSYLFTSSIHLFAFSFTPHPAP